MKIILGVIVIVLVILAFSPVVMRWGKSVVTYFKNLDN